jgi:nitrite reductase/ring-hydroxylating ferredoxin subunit
MSQPIVVTLPHQLGKAEALRRLQASLSDAQSSGAGLLVFKNQWSGDHLDFRASLAPQGNSLPPTNSVTRRIKQCPKCGPASTVPPTRRTSFARRPEELRAAGKIVVRGARCPLLVVYDHGKVFALDNRCPHLGFPLHRGSVEDGILTCHWHHARFDLASGCTFDLWADDVPTAAVEVRDGVVWVCPHTRYTDGDAHWRRGSPSRAS